MLFHDEVRHFFSVMTQITFIRLCNNIQNWFECNWRSEEIYLCSPATGENVLLMSLHYCIVKDYGIWHPYTVLPQDSLVCIWMSKLKMFWLFARTPIIMQYNLFCLYLFFVFRRLQLEEFLLQAMRAKVAPQMARAMGVTNAFQFVRRWRCRRCTV